MGQYAVDDLNADQRDIQRRRRGESRAERAGRMDVPVTMVAVVIVVMMIITVMIVMIVVSMRVPVGLVRRHWNKKPLGSITEP
jgi:hypothetical protein